MLIDSHAHLDFPDFKEDLPEILERAQSAQVDYIIQIAIDSASIKRTLELLDKYPQIYAAIGIHPSEADKVTLADIALVEKHLNHPKVVAVGEIGLDFYRDYAMPDNQHRLFREMLDLAKRYRKPVVIHNRKAFEETLRILEEKGMGEYGGVFHCFAGNGEMAWKAIKAGFHISFAGNLTYPKTELSETASAVPLEKTLVETDCPFLAPQAKRGKRCEPGDVRFTAEKLAEIKKLSLNDVARITSNNVYRLFGIGEEPESRIVYSIRESLYLNLTNRCTCDCVFCPRLKNPMVKGHNLKLEQEPDFEEVVREVEKFPPNFRELVFCGYGEPTLRLDLVKRLAEHFRSKFKRIRMDTNGHGNLINERDIVPELRGLIDIVSVSLNAGEAKTYLKLNRPHFGEKAFPTVLDFIHQCRSAGMEVTATIVGYPGAEVEASEKLTRELGINFRIRKFNDLG
jgi:TatD DNase family protein